MWNNTYFCSDLKTTIRHIALITVLILALSAKAQETLVPDSTLHLPELNSLGQMHAISRWPSSYGLMGYQNWDLHKGMNLTLQALASMLQAVQDLPRMPAGCMPGLSTTNCPLQLAPIC